MNDDNGPRRGVTGIHTTAGVPHGFTALTPFVAIENAAAAVAFYRDVFAARVVDRTEIDSVLVHAELDLGNGRLQLGEPNSAYGLVPPPDGEVACYSLGLYVADVDAVLERAVTAGATVREPVSNFVSGDRYCAIVDPFNVRWSLMSRVEDLTEAQSVARVAQWAAQQGS